MFGKMRSTQVQWVSYLKAIQRPKNHGDSGGEKSFLKLVTFPCFHTQMPCIGGYPTLSQISTMNQHCLINIVQSACFVFTTNVYNHLQASTIIYNHLQSSTIMYNHLQSFTIIYNHLQSFTIIYNHLQSSTIIYNHLQ